MYAGRAEMRCGCSCHWRWSWLKFGDGKIVPSDVDQLFVADRRGHLLFMECKSPGSKIPDGQSMMLETLSWIPRCTVLVIWGTNSTPERWKRIDRGVHLPDSECSREILQEFVSEWTKDSSVRFNRGAEYGYPGLSEDVR